MAGDLAKLVDRDRVSEHLAAYVRIPSENPPGAEAEVAALAAQDCAELGFDVGMHEVEPGRPSVVARWKGADGPTFAFCSHLDVVPAGQRSLWARAPFGAEIVDGRLHGRGSSDAKGSVVAALEAVKALRQSGWEPNGTLELLLVADEETMGFNGAGHLVTEGIVSPDRVIVGEPTSLRVVVAQRGAAWFRLTTLGRAAHGSAPERGVSAIKHMAEVIPLLEEMLPDISHPVVGGPSISVGTISGGEKTNIVPASCSIEIDRRSIPGETTESLLAQIRAAVEAARKRFPDIETTIETLFTSLPFEVDPGARLVVDTCAAVADATGRPAETIGFRGASDARFFAETGVEVVVCGPGEISLAHTAEESIDLDELALAAVVYARAFARSL